MKITIDPTGRPQPEELNKDIQIQFGNVTLGFTVAHDIGKMSAVVGKIATIRMVRALVVPTPGLYGSKLLVEKCEEIYKQKEDEYVADFVKYKGTGAVYRVIKNGVCDHFIYVDSGGIEIIIQRCGPLGVPTMEKVFIGNIDQYLLALKKG